jgi:hypothetical protein
MPLSVACLMTSFSASSLVGFRMMAFTPAEIRLLRSSICPAVSVLRLTMTIFETSPEIRAWAFIEQIISSRQPLPCSELETPMMYDLVVDAAPLVGACATGAGVHALRISGTIATADSTGLASFGLAYVPLGRRPPDSLRKSAVRSAGLSLPPSRDASGFSAPKNPA